MIARIHEWKSLLESNKDFIGIDKLNESFNTYRNEIKGSKKTIGKFDKRNIYERDKDVYNQGNNVGIINIDKDCRIEFIPKFDNAVVNENNFWKFLPHMLGTVRNYDDFNEKIFLDPDKKIVLPEGLSIVSLLTLSFINICRKVLEKGIIKRYILKNERLKAIRGRINYSDMSKKNAWDYSIIPCTYNELTFDNTENRIILWCAYRLLKEVKKLEKKGSLYIGMKLREIFTLLNEEITLEPQNLSSFRKINLSGISHHYLDIMNICKAILSEKIFSFEDGHKKKRNYGINFIIDMDWVFESYMTYLFKVVADEINGKDLTKKNMIVVESQSIGNLCNKDKISIRPDLIVKINGETKAILDFKWKLHEKNNNADFYQIICYSLSKIAQTNSKRINASLLSVSENEVNESLFDEPYDTISKELKDDSIIEIFKIPVSSSLLNGSSDYIEINIKEKVIRKYFENLIRSDIEL